MNEQLYVDAEEASAMLGVNLSTLYAYVSRKGLRSFPAEGSRKRRYWREDIEALRRGAGARQAPMAELVGTTTLTLLTDAGLFYRGEDATALADHATLEEVAALLWGTSSAVFDERADPGPATMPALLAALGDLRRPEAALSLLPAIEDASPRAFDLSPPGFVRTSATVLRWLAAIVTGSDAPSARPIHEVVARAACSDGRYDDLARRALILAADHELHPTTYAVRAAANTGVTPFGAALVGLAVSRGQRLRQWKALHTTRFVRELLDSPDPSREVLQLIRVGEPIPGFSETGVHRGHDPRASALIEAMRRQLFDQPAFARLDRAIRTAEEATGTAPQFILPTTFLGLQIGYMDEPLVFLMPGRAAGWLAHALEQYASGDLRRPRALYVGPLPNADGPKGARGETSLLARTEA